MCECVVLVHFLSLYLSEKIFSSAKKPISEIINPPKVCVYFSVFFCIFDLLTTLFFFYLCFCIVSPIYNLLFVLYFKSLLIFSKDPSLYSSKQVCMCIHINLCKFWYCMIQSSRLASVHGIIKRFLVLFCFFPELLLNFMVL